MRKFNLSATWWAVDAGTLLMAGNRGSPCERLPIRSGLRSLHRGSLPSVIVKVRSARGAELGFVYPRHVLSRRDRPSSKCRWSGHCNGGRERPPYLQGGPDAVDHHGLCSSDSRSISSLGPYAFCRASRTECFDWAARRCNESRLNLFFSSLRAGLADHSSALRMLIQRRLLPSK